MLSDFHIKAMRHELMSIFLAIAESHANDPLPPDFWPGHIADALDYRLRALPSRDREDFINNLIAALENSK